VDDAGNTPGDISLSLNDATSYRIIRDAGLRSGKRHPVNHPLGFLKLNVQDFRISLAGLNTKRRLALYRVSEYGQQCLRMHRYFPEVVIGIFQRFVWTGNLQCGIGYGNSWSNDGLGEKHKLVVPYIPASISHPIL